MHKVSIIIPIYNVEQFLNQCLDSVINQTYTNLEIICVNDCSSDGSLKIIENYAAKDERIKIIDKTNNEGLSAARNSGIDIATGEYLYFLDSDDWIDLDYIEKMVNAIKNSDVDIVIASGVISEKETSGIKYNHPSFKKEYENNFVDYKVAIQNLMVNAWNRLLKREFVEKYNLKFPKGYINEDLYFHYISIVNTDRVFVTSKSNYHYRSRENGISKSEIAKDIMNMYIYDLIYDYYEKNDLLEKGVKIFSVWPFFSVDNDEKYKVYKKYFEKTNEYLFNHQDIYNDLDMFFAKNVLETHSFEDYKLKFPASVTISYLRRKK